MAREENVDFISALTVQGFKSFAEAQRLELRPLTLLAGANSSGKSSALQPLLLLKQTLEAAYDPGPLLLDGPNVRFTSADQVLTRQTGRTAGREFRIGIELGSGRAVTDVFQAAPTDGFELESMVLSTRGGPVTFRAQMTKSELEVLDLSDLGLLSIARALEIRRNRCFFELKLGLRDRDRVISVADYQLTSDFIQNLLSMIHVPGLRGNPSRTYRKTGVEKSFFPGIFEHYIAGVISIWQEDGKKYLDLLAANLCDLGLTWTIQARPLDATQVELVVGRLPRKRGAAGDVVNIADVGFGVSQVLPVLVALLAASPGQLVYIEQPELHLHPRAQEALAWVLAAAANRGVRVVVETHSSLLLLAVQTLVVEGKLPSDNVKLHWFQRDIKGMTSIRSADLDALGAYGDWPEDFAQVRSGAENRYLNAVESQVFPPRKHARKR